MYIVGVLGTLGPAMDRTALADKTYTCPTDVGPGVVINPGIRGGCSSGGMAGDGWDGGGQNSAFIFWHVRNTTPDMGADQRTALINAMQNWAGAAQITFFELPVSGVDGGVDWLFASGNHGGLEPHEADDAANCAFDGGGGVLAHAGFPPGVNQTCGGSSEESFSGNVHFDEAETWELNNAGGAGPFSLTYVATHELGHAIGLTHSSGSGDVMGATVGSTTAYAGLSSNDICNIQNGYASGVGSVVTLESSGVWVDADTPFGEFGTQPFPFDTVTEGVNGVPPFSNGVIVHIQAGSYPEAVLATQNMILQAENGSVLIGS